MDLGAGSGAFATCLKNTKYFNDVITLDISPDCVEACKKLGLTAIRGTINDLATESVDMIFMNDLFEHLFDPGSFLIQCNRILRHGGSLSIATPNGQGFDFKIMKSKTRNITPPGHITYFNTYSLDLLLAKHRFSVNELTTPGILDVEITLKEKLENDSLKENNEYLDYLFTQNESILSNFQNFLADNKLSSHMLVIAQKT